MPFRVLLGLSRCRSGESIPGLPLAGDYVSPAGYRPAFGRLTGGPLSMMALRRMIEVVIFCLSKIRLSMNVFFADISVLIMASRSKVFPP